MVPVEKGKFGRWKLLIGDESMKTRMNIRHRYDDRRAQG